MKNLWTLRYGSIEQITAELESGDLSVEELRAALLNVINQYEALSKAFISAVEAIPCKI